MEWFWSVLGIEPTNQISRVKQAYVVQVRQLKQVETKREVKPESYQKLVEAEKAAVAFIEKQQSQSKHISVMEQSEATFQAKEIAEKLQAQEQAVKASEEAIEKVKETSFATTKQNQKIKEPTKPTLRQQTARVTKVSEEPIEKFKGASHVATKANQQPASAIKPTLRQQAGRAVKANEEPLEKVKETIFGTIKEKPKVEKSTKSTLTQRVERVANASKQLIEKGKEAIKDPVEGTKRPANVSKSPVPVQVIDQANAILADWSRRINIQEWRGLFSQRKNWNGHDFVEIKENFEGIIKSQLIYLPKTILFYLYDELGLEATWHLIIAKLPDFSFEIALYLPEEESFTYLKKRYQLYNKLSQDESQFESIQVKELMSYFFKPAKWQVESELDDQDVLNLGVIYHTKANIDELLKENSDFSEIEPFLLSKNQDLANVQNRTAKWLRLIFTTINNRKITLEQSVYLENRLNNYVDDNLQELLLGVAFFRSKELVKAQRHFLKVKNEYQSLVQPLVRRAAAQNEASMQKLATLKGKSPKSKLGFMNTLRGTVVVVVGLALTVNLIVGNRTPEPYTDVYHEEDFEEFYGEEDKPEIGELFYELFVEEVDSDYVYDERQEFIENYVADDEIKLLFDRYLTDELTAVADGNEELSPHMIKRTFSDNENRYLYSQGEEVKTLLFVENGEVVRVLGEQWEKLPSEEFDVLAGPLKISQYEVQEGLINEYYLASESERLDKLDELESIVSEQVFEKLAQDVDGEAYLELVDGYYLISKTDEGQPLLLVMTKQDELVILMSFDKIGRVIRFERDNLAEISATEKAVALKNVSSEKNLISY